jgi:hypothetical protein
MVVTVVDQCIDIVKDTIAGIGTIFIVWIEECAVMYRGLKDTLRTVGYTTQ